VAGMESSLPAERLGRRREKVFLIINIKRITL